MRIFVRCLLALMAALLPTVAFAEVVVSQLRFGIQESATRIVFDVDAEVTPVIKLAGDPNRLIVVFEGARYEGSQSGPRKAVGLVRSFRYTQPTKGTSRIEIQMSQPFSIEAAFGLPPNSVRGNRFVIDVLPASAAEFRAALASDPTPKTLAMAPPLPQERPESAPVADEAAAFEGMSPAEEAPPPTDLAPAAAPAETPVAEEVAPPAEEEDPLRLLAELPAPSPAELASPPPVMARLPVAKPGPVIATGPQKRVIVIDPGHGGDDPGAVGISGVYEKDTTLRVGKLVTDLLARDDRYHVVMTRTTDVYVPLRERVEIARRSKADLFLSLHADSLEQREVRGASVYTLSESASDTEAATLAAKENRSDLVAGIDMKREAADVSIILIELSQRATMNEAVRFSRILMPELAKRTLLVRNTHRFAGFRVLTAPDVPSVLIELGYMSNREDERNLRSDAWRSAVAQGIEAAVDAFFEDDGTRAASVTRN